MSEKPIVLTDPARELAELCMSLQHHSHNRGDSYLAEQFAVTAASKEFYQIIFAIVERCSLLQNVVHELEIDDDYKAEQSAHISEIMDAFSVTSLSNSWVNHGLSKISAVNVGPLKAISSSVRQIISYRKLSAEEIDNIDTDLDNILTWLHEHQLSEQDFIRQSIIDGIYTFRFRLNKIQWLGWGYALDSFREVIAAYMLLENSHTDNNKNPAYGAMLKKVGSTIQSIYKYVSTSKDVVDTGNWVFKAYTVGSITYHSSKPIIMRLIGNQ